jgi:ribonuclease III family protein
MDAYYSSVVGDVRAEAQAVHCRSLEDGAFLMSGEKEVLRWGRNAPGTMPRRLAQAGGTREVYRAATAVECLVGYLYLTDPPRLHLLMEHLGLGGGPGARGAT